MALVSAQSPLVTGLLSGAGFATPTTSETFNIDSGLVYHIKIGATATTVTVVIPGSAYGTARPDAVIASAATSTERYWNLFTPDVADPATGLITITFSQTTNVTCALIRA